VWALLALASIPGLAFGLASLYVLLLPVVLVGGIILGQSRLPLRLASCVLGGLATINVALAIAFASTNRTFYLVYGTSSLIAILVTFKAGMVLRERLR
jgi:hypothetical protein